MGRRNEALEMINKSIGQKIRQLRLSKGLSSKQLGEKINVTYQQISKYENGIDHISGARLDIVARALDTQISYFFAPETRELPISNPKGRLQIEMARVFEEIPSRKQQAALVALARTFH